MVREWTRESFSRHHAFAQDRFGQDALDDTRFHEVHDIHRRQPPMQIDEALRQHCSISSRRYFVAVIMEDGNPMTFAGPGPRLEDEVINQFFDSAKYRRVMDNLDAGMNPMVDESFGFESSMYRQPMDFPRSRIMYRRRLSGFDDWDSPVRQGRKRPRARHPANDDEDIPMMVSTTRKGIKVGNSNDVWNFYEQRFKSCQQTACKLIAKAWVKAVEPKKQSTHPYTGSDEKAPGWWPKPWGPTKEDKVRHKEPDHLYKRERVHLLNHILRMIVEPRNTQHPDIQKLNLNVTKLEEITIEALSAFFTDKETPANGRKRPYLNEIFKVAKQEERFKNGEIDGTTEVLVVAEDRFPEVYISENDEVSLVKENEENDVSPAKPTAPHGIMQTSAPDQTSTAAMNVAGPFLGDLLVRSSQYAPPMMQEIATNQHSFVESNGLQVSGQTQIHPTSTNMGIDMDVSSPHDTSRRPSLFSASGEYSSQGGAALYGQAWQPGSTAPNSSSMYSYTHQQPNPSSTHFVNQAVLMASNQTFMGNAFDGIPITGYESGQSSMFRAGGVPPQAVHPPQAYNYVTHDGRGLSGIKAEPATHESMH